VPLTGLINYVFCIYVYIIIWCRTELVDEEVWESCSVTEHSTEDRLETVVRVSSNDSQLLGLTVDEAEH